MLFFTVPAYGFAFVVCPHPVLGPLLTVTMITLRILAALLRTVYTPKAYTLQVVQTL